MQLVHVAMQAPEAFEEIRGHAAIQELRTLAEELRGLRVLPLGA